MLSQNNSAPNGLISGGYSVELHFAEIGFLVFTSSDYLDSFTVSLNRLLSSGLSKGIVSGFWKTVEIPNNHVSPQSNGTAAIPYI